MTAEYAFRRANVGVGLAEAAGEECERLRERLTLQDQMIDALRNDYEKLLRRVLELENADPPTWPEEVADVD